ncbi:MAG: Fic family protein [Crocinitomicaceae bacterium]|nr:Fic family protein [Crocinitomicaceae bacterium]
MSITKAGNLWLKEHFQFKYFSFTHSSYIGNNDKIEIVENDRIDQIYSSKYAPKDTVLEHLVFSLKYDDLDLTFIKSIFERIPTENIVNYVSSSPGGKYARKIGFLYEFVTQKELKLNVSISGNYVDLLDESKYCTGNTIKNTKWRINNNLLGTSDFCPIIRRTVAVKEILEWDISASLEQLKHDFSKDIFRRATNYLYSKETRSSYEIESEKPSPDRMERFIAILTKAGSKSGSEVLSETDLITLQNAIIDPRFAATGFRDFQNYIGESLPNFIENIHYICPPPQYVKSLMEGLRDSDQKCKDISAVVKATITSFGFVFIHPFEDGNGRLHRFLIHDSLVRSGAVPKGFIIPVSAYMLNNMAEYDQTLEYFSKPLMKRIKYHKNTNEELIVENPKEVESYFRFPDLTKQCVFMGKTIQETLTSEMPNELLFIQRYDELKHAIQNIIDMPDKAINQIILFIHQNKGTLPKRRRKTFEKLTDEEITSIETVYQEIFEIKGLKINKTP